MPRIERSGQQEEKKLRMIGSIVDATLEDFKPVYGSAETVRPSVLPNHDDKTIDFLANIQRKLREKSGKPPEVQALILEHAEHAALVLQSEERT